MSKFGNIFRLALGVLINVLLIKNVTLAGETSPAISQTTDSLKSISSLEQVDRYTRN